MGPLPKDDQNQLQKLLLGQLPRGEAERGTAEYIANGRLAELDESLSRHDKTLPNLLSEHETAADLDAERPVEPLSKRLQLTLAAQLNDEATPQYLASADSEADSPPAAPAIQALPARLEHYRPIKVLGQGGMGTVYLAEDTRLGREVAVKTLRPELAGNPHAKERFQREARTAAKLGHDHIVPIYYVGEADGIPFLGMPVLKGDPLNTLLRQIAGPVPVTVAVRIAREAASGLAAAHEAGLIHRDIKPANIWLEAPGGRAKVLDFGLAKAANLGGEADADISLTANGAIVGTPAYMAPEQAGGGSVDARADLFSLGCVLNEMISGRRPFSGPDTMAILMSLGLHKPPAPHTLNPQCSAALSRLVMQLLEKDPAARPASAQAVIQALAEFEGISPVELETIAPPGCAILGRAEPEGGSAAAVRGALLDPHIGIAAQHETAVPKPAPAASPVRERPASKHRVAIALAGLLLPILAAAVVYRIQTDQGTLIVQIEDPAVQAILEEDGLVIRDKKSERTWNINAAEKQSLPSGEYQLVEKRALKLRITDDSGADLTTDAFTLKRQGEIRVRVTMEQTVPVAGQETAKTKPFDPDRRAAEWVLSIGGLVAINENGDRREITVAGQLPQNEFELTRAYLSMNPKVTDPGLTHFEGLPRISHPWNFSKPK